MSSSNPHRHLDVLVDYAGRTDCQPVFVGWADAGSLAFTSEPVWQIMRADYDGAGRLIDRLWAQLPSEERGNNNYNKIWDLRATYAYN
jgi:YD repeat-containing protein